MKHMEYAALNWSNRIMLLIRKGERILGIIPDKKRNVPSYYYMIFNVLIYVAVMQTENSHLKWMRLMEVGTLQWLLSGLDATGCEGIWPQSSSCSVPPAEKSCLSRATTYFQSVTGMQSSVRLWLSLSLSLWSKEHPNPVTEQKGDLC